jgi:hypothetical protein
MMGDLELWAHSTQRVTSAFLGNEVAAETDARPFAVVRTPGGRITIFRSDCGLLDDQYYPEAVVLERVESFAEAMAATRRYLPPEKEPGICGWCRPAD